MISGYQNPNDFVISKICCDIKKYIFITRFIMFIDIKKYFVISHILFYDKLKNITKNVISQNRDFIVEHHLIPPTLDIQAQ